MPIEPLAPTADDEPLAWRNRLALTLLRAFVVVFALSLVVILIAMHGARERLVLTCAVLTGLFVMGIPAVTGRPTGTARAWIVIAPATLLPIVGFASVGFLSGPGVSLTVTIMLTGLLLGGRTMIGSTIFCLLAVSAIAWAIVHGHLRAPPPADHDMTRGLPWARSVGMTFLAISLFGGLMVAIVTRMERALRFARQETLLRQQAEKERAEAELAALESKQLELVGRLAAGVAHDFNNNLTAIMGCTELLQGELAEGTTGRELSDSILQSSRRLADLTRQLLAYSRKATMVKAPTDLHALIKDALSLVKRSASPNVRVLTKLDAGGGATVAADVALLEAAILNLLVNACDAMPEGGTLTVSTTWFANASETGAKDIVAGPRVLLEVLDTGHGIAADVLPFIFDPFFTTKAVGRGTGLGLAAVAGTIKALGGKIDAESDVGIGTAFRIYLPTIEWERSVVPSAADAVVPGEGNILLVEDDAVVSMTATTTLQSLGYRVTPAADGASGIALVRAAPRRFDLVLLDLRMAGLGGQETFAALREIAPDLKVLIWSGYAAEQDVGGMLARGAVGFVQKPYRVSDLSRAIADALQRT